MIVATISSGAEAVGSWDTAIPEGCPLSVWAAVRWKRGGKSGERQKARYLASILESYPGYSEQQLHQHLASLDLPFYYPPAGPALAADRETGLEELIGVPAEESAEPTTTQSGSEEETEAWSGRERSPRRELATPPKARPRPRPSYQTP